MTAAVAHYRELAFQAAMGRVLASPTHPQHQQLVDLMETIMLDTELTMAASPLGDRGDSGHSDANRATFNRLVERCQTTPGILETPCLIPTTGRNYAGYSTIWVKGRTRSCRTCSIERRSRWVAARSAARQSAKSQETRPPRVSATRGRSSVAALPAAISSHELTMQPTYLGGSGDSGDVSRGQAVPANSDYCNPHGIPRPRPRLIVVPS